MQISPDQRTIVSVGAEGAIFLWKMPDEVTYARADNELPTISKEKYSNNNNVHFDNNNSKVSEQGSVASKANRK